MIVTVNTIKSVSGGIIYYTIRSLGYFDKWEYFDIEYDGYGLLIKRSGLSANKDSRKLVVDKYKYVRIYKPTIDFDIPVGQHELQEHDYDEDSLYLTL